MLLAWLHIRNTKFDSRCREVYKDSQQAYCRILSGDIVSNREGYDRRFRPEGFEGYNAWLNDLLSCYSGTSSVLNMSSEESASFHRAFKLLVQGDIYSRQRKGMLEPVHQSSKLVT